MRASWKVKGSKIPGLIPHVSQFPDSQTLFYNEHDGLLYALRVSSGSAVVILIGGGFLNVGQIHQRLHAFNNPEDHAAALPEDWGKLMASSEFDGSPIYIPKPTQYIHWSLNSDSSKTVVYGSFFNWFAVNDPRHITPEGWSIPSDADWSALTNYISLAYNIEPTAFGIGNHLKSCRQINSPLGGSCDTNIHPRWNEHPVNYGRDTVGLKIVPAGFRDHLGAFFVPGPNACFWSSSEATLQDAFYHAFSFNSEFVTKSTSPKNSGFSLKAFRQATLDEFTLPDGTLLDNYVGNDQQAYETVKINNQVWTVQNLIETRYRNGDIIPVVTDDYYWSEILSGSTCVNSNTESNSWIPKSYDILSKDIVKLSTGPGIKINFDSISGNQTNINFNLNPSELDHNLLLNFETDRHRKMNYDEELKSYLIDP